MEKWPWHSVKCRIKACKEKKKHGRHDLRTLLWKKVHPQVCTLTYTHICMCTDTGVGRTVRSRAGFDPSGHLTPPTPHPSSEARSPRWQRGGPHQPSLSQSSTALMGPISGGQVSLGSSPTNAPHLKSKLAPACLLVLTGNCSTHIAWIFKGHKDFFF